MATPPVPANRRKPSGRRRTLEQMDKDARILALHLQGKSYRQIMAAMAAGGEPIKSYSTVNMAIKRAVLDRQKNAFEQMDDYTIAIEGIQRLIAYHEGVIAAKHYVVSTTGKVVRDDETGERVLDSAPGQRSAAELRHLRAELAKLQGTYAPTKSRQEVITQDVVDRENAQFAAEIERLSREMERGGEAPHPGVIREP